MLQVGQQERAHRLLLQQSHDAGGRFHQGVAQMVVPGWQVAATLPVEVSRAVQSQHRWRDACHGPQP
jgi:hypothetical protein